MNLSIQLFAAAKDAAGNASLQVQLSDSPTVAELRNELVAACPELKVLAPMLLIAVNQEYAGNETELQPTDQVACFPPVSGG